MTIDTGNTGFMLLCASLVMLMTPGLAFFYGGLVGRKNVLAIMIQSFVSHGLDHGPLVRLRLFALLQRRPEGGSDVGGIIGNLDWAFLRGITLDTPSPSTTRIPHDRLLRLPDDVRHHHARADHRRVRQPRHLQGLHALPDAAGCSFVYFPFVHMIWGGGILAKWGVLDFAGGIVVHNIAGIAALASVLYVGKRKVVDRGPHSIPLVALGTGLLWFGWYGFNAGSEFRVDSVTAIAFLNTDIAASLRRHHLARSWTGSTTKKPKFLGLLTGAVAGPGHDHARPPAMSRPPPPSSSASSPAWSASTPWR